MRVALNVYALRDFNEANEFLSSVGLGFYHSGVEIDGREYSYAPNVGIYDTSPRSVPNAVFRGTVEMGQFEGGRATLADAIDSLRARFTPSGYDIMTNNCNAFADALVFELTTAHVPPWINRMALLGSCVACLLPRHLLKPPDGLPAPSRGTTVSANTTTSFQAFQGTGYSMAAESAGAASPSPTDLSAKIRAATLRRLDASPD
ncbi:hypothetical protein CTAYLR_005120 [Chrysophaeum taylorii]|uniref:PPPDE domain-containing protein n=1 Tax=Chrysophaeum taylorii TaxID=2483200 RepID=A0AAD7UEA2_9STRA|nr:hypothetical protein CTAYLR_005120 [Chrysophaeum taylorii]